MKRELIIDLANFIANLSEKAYSLGIEHELEYLNLWLLSSDICSLIK